MLKVNWIGLNLIPPLLLGLQERRDQEEEQREWETIEENAGFYPQAGTPYEVLWDVKEATRAMHELHISE